jgi:hypothetical protein
MSEYNPLYDDKFIAEIALTRAGGLYALVYSKPDFRPDLEEADLSPLIGVLEFAASAIPIEEDFDFGDEHTRGPYDINQLNLFYTNSGLKDVCTTYFDEDSDCYYVYINTD